MSPPELPSPPESQSRTKVDPPLRRFALQRTCLSCKSLFDSAWAGERICLRCKGKKIWRSGASSSASSFDQPRSRSSRKSGS